MSDIVNESMKKGEETQIADNSEPEYVVVSSSPTDEPIELPTNADDNSLGITTLSHAFPGAHGLKYKNPKTGASRALLIDSTGTKFMPPAGGWNDKLFTVIFHAETSSKRSMPGEQNPKRKKMMDNSVSSGSEDGDGNVQGAKMLRLNNDEDDEKFSSQKQNAKNETVDLLILGLPFDLEEDKLRDYFSEHGRVIFFEIKKDRDGKSRGFGFVRMSSMAEQTSVLNATHNIGGRRCHVKFPLQKEDDPRNNQATDVRLFVGKLDRKITVKRLRDFFNEEAQKIDPKALLTDVFIPNTPFRGFGFINLSNAAVAKALLKKDNFVIDEVSIALSIASPKQQQQPQQHQQHPPQSQYGYGEYQAPSGSFERRGYYEPNFEGYPEHWGQGHRPMPNNGRNFNGEYFEDAPYPEAAYPSNNSNSISTGLETLNLNMKPDVMNEALKAFWSAASRTNMQNAPPNFHPQQHGGRQSGYPQQQARRGHHPGSSPSSRWR